MIEAQRQVPVKRSTLYYIIWTVIFGTTLGIGGGFFEAISISFLNITAASFLVAIIITLNKLVVSRKFSVTFMYLITGTIAIFTPYLGPPSVFKPLFFLAGLSFDAATLFRTDNIKLWNILFGHFVVTVVGFFLFWVNLSIMIPDSSEAVIPLLLAAAPFHFLVSIILGTLIFKLIPPMNPPKYVQNIKNSMSIKGKKDSLKSIDKSDNEKNDKNGSKR